MSSHYTLNQPSHIRSSWESSEVKDTLQSILMQRCSYENEDMEISFQFWLICFITIVFVFSLGLIWFLFCVQLESLFFFYVLLDLVFNVSLDCFGLVYHCKFCEGMEISIQLRVLVCFFLLCVIAKFVLFTVVNFACSCEDEDMEISVQFWFGLIYSLFFIWFLFVCNWNVCLF